MSAPIPASHDLTRRLRLPHAAQLRRAEKAGELRLEVFRVLRDRLLVVLDLLVARLDLRLVLGVLRPDRDGIALVGEHQRERGRLVLIRQESTGIRTAAQQTVVLLRIEPVTGVVGRLGLLRPVQPLGDGLGVIVLEVRIG